MTDITVTALGELQFGVETAEGEQARSSHTVTVPQDLLDDLGLGPEDADGLVRESFEFLLEREKPTQILREFSLDEIGGYFPEYRSEIAARVAP
jgi:hypothetical protein